jgi:hypothetical protein
MTPTYDPDKVDELLTAAIQVNELFPLGSGPIKKRLDDAIAALRPKPIKFYVMPEWETPIRGLTSFLSTMRATLFTSPSIMPFANSLPQTSPLFTFLMARIGVRILCVIFFRYSSRFQHGL